MLHVVAPFFALAAIVFRNENKMPKPFADLLLDGRRTIAVHERQTVRAAHEGTSGGDARQFLHAILFLTTISRLKLRRDVKVQCGKAVRLPYEGLVAPRIARHAAESKDPKFGVVQLLCQRSIPPTPLDLN